jgi:hypothetical protein
LAATLKRTVPLPVPVAPDAIVIHAAPVVAVHEHSLPVETMNGSLVPPASVKDAVSGDTLNVHDGGGGGGGAA